MRMPFGKHMGTHIAKIPSEYLQWAIKNVQFKSPVLKREIEAELTTREQQAYDLEEFSSFSNDPDDDVPF